MCGVAIHMALLPGDGNPYHSRVGIVAGFQGVNPQTKEIIPLHALRVSPTAIVLCLASERVPDAMRVLHAAFLERN